MRSESGKCWNITESDHESLLQYLFPGAPHRSGCGDAAIANKDGKRKRPWPKARRNFKRLLRAEYNKEELEQWKAE